MRKIYVSFTSWSKRIHHVCDTLFYLTEQTLQPDKIYLTLSTDEFPNKEIPEPLKELETILNFEIIWVKENTKAFKKLIPVLSRHKDEDCWILTIDDDVVYDNTYIETIVNDAENNFGKIINPGICGNWIHGFAAIYHPTYFKETNIFELTPKEMIDLVEDDRYLNDILKQDKVKCEDIKYHLTLMNYEFPLNKIYGQK